MLSANEWRAERRRQQRLSQGRPHGPQKKRGRPVDSSSLRQRALAAGLSCISRLPEKLAVHKVFLAERAAARQRQRDLDEAVLASRRAQRYMGDAERSLKRTLAQYPEHHRHAAACYFWREKADSVSSGQRPLQAAGVFAARARAKWASAMADAAAWAAAAAAASTDAEMREAAAALKAATAFAALTGAVRVAAAAVAVVAERHLKRAGSCDLDDLTDLDQPWFVSAFEAANVSMDDAPPPPPAPSLPPPPPPPPPPASQTSNQSTSRFSQEFPTPSEESRAAAKRSRDLALAEWESDVHIDRDHEPPWPAELCRSHQVPQSAAVLVATERSESPELYRDEELPPGLYRDKDGNIVDLDDGSYY